jgi:surface protein
VFTAASAFNGDLNQWDVTSVIDMSGSKSIHTVEDDLTCRGNGFGVGSDDDVM